jgi:hypothetical protein
MKCQVCVAKETLHGLVGGSAHAVVSFNEKIVHACLNDATRACAEK